MVKFKGQLSFRQYLPSKPIKWGIKVWSLCKASTGYAYQMQVYTGRKPGAGQEKGLSHRVVMDLVQPLWGTREIIHGQFLHNFPAVASGPWQQVSLPAGLCGPTVKVLPPLCIRRRSPWSMGSTVWLRGTVCHMSSGRTQRQCWPCPQCNTPLNLGLWSGGVSSNTRKLSKYPSWWRIINETWGLRTWWTSAWALPLSAQVHKMVAETVLLTVSANNAYILAKDQGNESTMKRWPSLLDFLESLAEDLNNDTCADRAPPLVRNPARQLQCHIRKKL